MPQPLVDTGGRQRDVLGAGLVQAAELRRARIRGVRPLKNVARRPLPVDSEH